MTWLRVSLIVEALWIGAMTALWTPVNGLLWFLTGSLWTASIAWAVWRAPQRAPIVAAVWSLGVAVAIGTLLLFTRKPSLCANPGYVLLRTLHLPVLSLAGLRVLACGFVALADRLRRPRAT